jgi:hypothetical protein
VRPLSPVWQCTFLPEPVFAWMPSGEEIALEKISLKNGIAPAHPGSAHASIRGSHTPRIDSVH